MKRKDHDIAWPRLGAESLAIVASILLAFAIDAWYQSVRDQKLAAQYEQSREEERQQIELRLKDELQKVLTDLEEMNTSVGRASQAAEETRNFFYGVVEPRDYSPTILLLYNLGQDYFVPLDTITYQDLVATGRIGLLSNANQRQSIQSAYQAMQSINTAIQPYREEFMLAVRGWIPKHITDQIRLACGLPMITTGVSPSTSILMCDNVQFDQDEAQAIIEHMSTDQALLAYQLRVQSLGAARGKLNEVKIKAEDALASFD